MLVITHEFGLCIINHITLEYKQFPKNGFSKMIMIKNETKCILSKEFSVWEWNFLTSSNKEIADFKLLRILDVYYEEQRALIIILAFVRWDRFPFGAYKTLNVF